MRGLAWAVVGISCLGCVTGCYRSAALPHEDLERVASDGQGALHAYYAEGKRLVFERYDEVEVETRDGEHRFGPPIEAHQQADSLTVAGGSSRQSFRLYEIEAITVRKYDGDRPWIIAATTAGFMLLGGVLGYTAAGECSSDSEPGCLGNFVYPMVGATVGLPFGLAIGFRETSRFEPRER